MLDSLKKAAMAVKLCKIPFHVNFQSRRIDREFSRKELTDRILLVKKTAVGTRFSFEDIQVTIADKQQADITATLRVDGRSPDGASIDAYETHLGAEKIEGDWLFSSFTVVEFMEK